MTISVRMCCSMTKAISGLAVQAALASVEFESLADQGLCAVGGEHQALGAELADVVEHQRGDHDPRTVELDGRRGVDDDLDAALRGSFQADP